MAAAVPHISLPIRIVGAEVGAGAFSVVEQDTIDELVCTVKAIISFPLGYRVEEPEFGIVDPELQDRPIDVNDIEAAVENYEPRAEVRVFEAEYDPYDPLASTVRVEVTMPGGEDS